MELKERLNRLLDSEDEQLDIKEGLSLLEGELERGAVESKLFDHGWKTRSTKSGKGQEFYHPDHPHDTIITSGKGFTHRNSYIPRGLGTKKFSHDQAFEFLSKFHNGQNTFKMKSGV